MKITSLLLCAVIGFYTSLSIASIYHDEFLEAITSETTVLGRAARLGSGPALGMLRVAQWHDYLAQTQSYRAKWLDTVGYFSMENETAVFADRCYVLPPEELPLLYATVREQAQRLGIMTPLLLVVDDRKLVDATSASCSAQSGFIVIGRGLLEEFSEQELCGVLLHYMGFIAQRYQLKMAVQFTPMFLVGLAMTLFFISKLQGSDRSISLEKALKCIGLLGGFGIGAALYWCALSRYYEEGADALTASVNAGHGLAMIEAMERCYNENLGGDLKVARDIIISLPHLSRQDVEKAKKIVAAMERMYDVARMVHEKTNVGLFAAHRPLAERKSFFKTIIDAPTDSL